MNKARARAYLWFVLAVINFGSMGFAHAARSVPGLVIDALMIGWCVAWGLHWWKKGIQDDV